VFPRSDLRDAGADALGELLAREACSVRHSLR
jgi:hypothetical protein